MPDLFAPRNVTILPSAANHGFLDVAWGSEREASVNEITHWRVALMYAGGALPQVAPIDVPMWGAARATFALAGTDIVTLDGAYVIVTPVRIVNGQVVYADIHEARSAPVNWAKFP